MTDLNDIALAKARANARRIEFGDSIDQLKTELSPDELRRRAAYEMGQIGRIASQRATKAVRDHPFVVVSIGATALLVLFRKPISRWLDDRWQPVGDWDVEQKSDDELNDHYADNGDNPDRLEEDDNR